MTRRKATKPDKIQRRAVASEAARSAKPSRVPLAIAAAILVVAGALAGAWWVWGGQAAGNTAAEQTTGVIGGVTGCRSLPRFHERLGYQDRLGIGTSERQQIGLVIFDGRVPLTADPAQRDIHQEPSWDDAGTLGPFTIDREGHIYTAPVPRTAVSDNPLGALNTVYRIDSDTALLEPFLTLPDSPGATDENPFGIMGLTYDCDTNALYVSTVAGSTRQAQRGRILRIDLATKAVSEQVVGIDAIGLGIFRGTHGKRLYIGLAREPALASVALDAEGYAAGEVRTESTLPDVGPAIGEPRIRRINFDQRYMVLYVVPFNFNLRAVSEQQQTVVRYRHDEGSDSWILEP